MREWIGVLILLVLGWITILTVQITDLYYKYSDLVEVNHTTRVMIIDTNQRLEQTQHDIVVHEQMCEALINGMEEW